MLDVRDDPAPGPNGIRHWDQSMQAVASLEISIGERFELASAVDEYVFGFCLAERANGPLGDEGSPGPQFDQMRDYVEGLIATGEYPALAAIREEPGLEDARGQMQRQIADPDRFDRNLQRLLDGFEAGMRSARKLAKRVQKDQHQG